MDLTPALAAAWIDRFAAAIEQNKDHLTELDGPIGDNDHGINMDRGMRAVHDRMDQASSQPIDAMLKAAGMTLIRSVGGASGPLYGTVFLRMAQATVGHDALDAGTLGQALEAGRQGIIDRGKAEPGDMTMLDAWDPAVRAYQEAVSSGHDLSRAVAAATRAAGAGMEATIPLVARKGRASYLGERSVGYQDPGATSSYLLFKSLEETVG